MHLARIRSISHPSQPFVFLFYIVSVVCPHSLCSPPLSPASVSFAETIINDSLSTLPLVQSTFFSFVLSQCFILLPLLILPPFLVLSISSASLLFFLFLPRSAFLFLSIFFFLLLLLLPRLPTAPFPFHITSTSSYSSLLLLCLAYSSF